MVGKSDLYEWKHSVDGGNVIRLDLGGKEEAFYIKEFLFKVLPWLFGYRGVVYVPSYSHWSILLILFCRLLNIPIVMMNESHDGTERTGRLGRLIKRVLIHQFGAALVGGERHVNHFRYNYGFRRPILKGYDVVDNQYFASAEVDSALSKALPSRYILNLGRFIYKKNLSTLVEAYNRLRKIDDTLKLLLVGSGECESEYEKIASAKNIRVSRNLADDADMFILPFQQYDLIPTFYKRSTVFVLPSIYEEWGLVVNEALACGTTVCVSREVGCSGDLVQLGVNGYVFDPLSVDDLFDKLMKSVKLAVEFDADAPPEKRIDEWGLGRFKESITKLNRFVLGEGLTV